MNRKAFTLVELLVVISVIGILMAMLFPALQAVRQAARRSTCSSNIRQVMLAALSHESTGLGFPVADDGRGGGMLVQMLPYFKETYLDELAGSNLAPGEDYDQRLVEMANSRIEILICPAAYVDTVTIADQGVFPTHYVGVMGPIGTGNSSDLTKSYAYNSLSPSPADGPIGLQGLFSPDSSGKFVRRLEKDILDGISFTFGFAELSHFNPNRSDAVDQMPGWAFGAEYDSSTDSVIRMYGAKSVNYSINSEGGTTLNDIPFGSNHPGGAMFALADGAVRFVSDEISLDILKAFSSINEVEKPERLE